MLERLYQYKQEISTRAHTCENVGSMESLDQVDATSDPSTLTKQAEEVNSQLNEKILTVRHVWWIHLTLWLVIEIKQEII